MTSYEPSTTENYLMTCPLTPVASDVLTKPPEGDHLKVKTPGSKLEENNSNLSQTAVNEEAIKFWKRVKLKQPKDRVKSNSKSKGDILRGVGHDFGKFKRTLTATQRIGGKIKTARQLNYSQGEMTKIKPRPEVDQLSQTFE